MSNSLWQIAFGPYALLVDRRTLRFDLRDTKADIVWAESLPLGWIELENRETGETSRHEFGDCKIISVSEKAGAQGKRILFGLDAPGGVPIDVYVICTEREIQLTVEASRDSKTHRVTGFGLVPGLVSVPDDGASYLVLPSCHGSGFFARDIPDHEQREKDDVPYSAFRFGIWQRLGVHMPFSGAVRAEPEAKSIADAPAGSLALITDSAYATFVLKRQSDGSATADIEYERDPERRRLDVRLVVLPGENHVGISRAYRDKIIGEKNHVTLRRKIRERPVVDKLIGAAWSLDHFSYINGWYDPLTNDAMWGDDVEQHTVAVFPEDNAFSRTVQQEETLAVQASGDLPENSENRWESIDEKLQDLTQVQQKEGLVAGMTEGGDWHSIVSDFWLVVVSSKGKTLSLPLTSVVYHDSLVMPFPVYDLVMESSQRIPASSADDFRTALLNLAAGLFNRWTFNPVRERNAPAAWRKPWRIATYSVLSPLHRLTFTAFLTAHRFLTPDALVEEAVYSDKTRIVINRSDANAYETPELHLPPGGFWVRHAQMEAHDALRVGEQTFKTRAFRIRRALDGKPLEQSADVETREYSV